MSRLIAQALEHGDDRTRRPVHTSPQEKQPPVLDRSPPTKLAFPLAAGSKKIRGDRLVEQSSERGLRGEGTTTAVTATSAVAVRAQWDPDTLKALRSPPRVRRVTSRSPALPTLACRSNTGQDHGRHKSTRGGKTEGGVGVSSAYLAEAIGCRNIPTGLRAVESDGDDTGRAALDCHDHDPHGNMFMLESMGNVFCAGLDLGKTRFRRTSTM